MKQSAHTPLQRLNLAILTGFLLIAGTLILWSVIRGPAILNREDNPRLVEAELRILRGRIFDQNDVILAETIGEGADLTRLYPVLSSGPAVGYYSFRHGTAGVEEGFDAILSGDNTDATAQFWQQTLHRPQQGSDVRLTLDADWQQLANNLLGEHIGAVLLLEVNGRTLDGVDILAMASHPGYDPNVLESDFDTLVADENAPLLNRAVQGQYQPGLVIMPMITAVALEQGIISLESNISNANRPVPIAEQVTNCESTPPETTTWADALYYRCPGPMADLGDGLGLAALNSIFDTFALTQSPKLPLNTELAVVEPLSDARLAGFGQDNLTVTPLQVALGWTALMNNGRLPIPYLVTAVKNENGQWESVESEGEVAETAVFADTARAIRQSLPKHENITEFSVRVLSGPDESVNSWYLGASAQHMVVIVLENVNDLSVVEEIGRTLLTISRSQ